MIFAGDLTETLEFHTVEDIQSESGFKSKKETYRFTCRAQRLKNQEYVDEDNAGEIFHVTTLTFRMRRMGVRETDIVVYRNERYSVVSVDELNASNEAIIKITKINE